MTLKKDKPMKVYEDNNDAPEGYKVVYDPAKAGTSKHGFIYVDKQGLGVKIMRTFVATDTEDTGLIWVWTETPNGTYSCPQAEFDLTQEEVDHDVKLGILKQV
jgi:hypothetical protein